MANPVQLCLAVTTSAPVVLTNQQAKIYTKLLEVMQRPAFLLVVGGPPGSGKSLAVKAAAAESCLCLRDFDIDG